MPSTFFQSLKTKWRRFTRIPPGRRFQKVYEDRQESRSAKHSGKRTGLLVTGTLIAIVGVVLLPLPGPGSIVLAGGLMLVASESVTAARMLDFADMHIHRFMQHFRRKWGQWTVAKRVMCAGAAGVLLAGAATGAWFALAR